VIKVKQRGDIDSSKMDGQCVHALRAADGDPGEGANEL